jgi:hypothetical protein
MKPATKEIYDKFKLLHGLAEGGKVELLLGVAKIPNEYEENAHARFWRHFEAAEGLADKMIETLMELKRKMGEDRGH